MKADRAKNAWLSSNPKNSTLRNCNLSQYGTAESEGHVAQLLKP